MLAQFMAAVESTIVGTAMPTIVGDLGGFHLFSWVFAAYLLAQAVSTPVYGRLADLYGRKRVFYRRRDAVPRRLARLRLRLGHGAAHRLPRRPGPGRRRDPADRLDHASAISMAPADRARMQGWLSSVFGVSAIAGPALGAFIVEHLHWSLVFWINLPVGIAAVVMLGCCSTSGSRRRRGASIMSGAVLLMLGVGALLVAMVQAREPRRRPDRASLVAVGVAGARRAWSWHEMRVAEPIVPFRLWRHPIIAIGNFGSLVIGVMMMCNGAYLPAYVQGAMGRSPAVAGFALGASSVVWTLGTIFVGTADDPQLLSHDRRSRAASSS